MSELNTDTTAVDLNDNGKFRTRLPQEVYNLFVPYANMKSDINLSLENTRDVVIKTDNTGSNTEKYTLQLASNVAYSACAIRTVDVTMNITGIRYSRNVLFDSLSISPDIEYEGPLDMAGLPHPYLPGICGFPVSYTHLTLPTKRIV